MAFESMLSKMGSGMKHFTDRYAEYGGPVVPDPHVLYAYEHPTVAHESSSKHHYGGTHKNNAAMSALTLLAFLFFLHILQQCIKEHMTAMSTPQITVMTAGREGEEIIKKSDIKLDKSGHTPPTDSESKRLEKYIDEGAFLTKINTAEAPSNNGRQTYVAMKDFEDRRMALSGFVSAMTD